MPRHTSTTTGAVQDIVKLPFCFSNAGSSICDLRGFFNVDPNVRPGFTKIEAEVVLDSPAPEHDLRRLKETVDRHCPVLDILRNPTPTELTLRTESLSVAAE